MDNPTYVLDASALLGYLYGEEEYDQLEGVLHSKCFIATLQLGEIYYVLLMEEGKEKAQSALASIRNTEVEIITVDEDMALEAGDIKAQTGLPYVDAVAAALANLNSATLVTSDGDFERLGGHLEVEVEWIGG